MSESVKSETPLSREQIERIRRDGTYHITTYEWHALCDMALSALSQSEGRPKGDEAGSQQGNLASASSGVIDQVTATAVRAQTLEEAAKVCEEKDAWNMSVSDDWRARDSKSGWAMFAHRSTGCLQCASAIRALLATGACQWIAVSERLPDVKYGMKGMQPMTSDDVLVYWPNDEIGIACFTTPDQWNDDAGHVADVEPTHWMPLPPPPGQDTTLQKTSEPHSPEAVAVAAQSEGWVSDAKRYRFLKQCDDWFQFQGYVECEPEGLDAAIDAAMSAAPTVNEAPKQGAI